MFSFKRENLAPICLQENSLQLIEQNYLTKCGEIDIIMLDKSE